MNLLARDALTIGSVITPPGQGGVSVIRVSGPSAADTVRKLISCLPAPAESHRIYYGHIRKLESQDKIDEVLVSYFAQGRSFTGDETVEISHHGSPVISKMILAELLSAGMRLALPGEFTFRAFLNRRIDLVQAEAILDLIQSKSERTAKLALDQLEGRLSRQLAELEQELTKILAHMEANLDFAQEDIVVESREKLQGRIQGLQRQFENLLAQMRTSQKLRHGFKVVLAGAPNVGKSSLLNALCEQEIAIVSDAPGTTRDVVFAEMYVQGCPVHLYDTAGLRDTHDAVEKLGIQKTEKKINESDLVLWIADATQRAQTAAGPANEKEILSVWNKIDRLSAHEFAALKSENPNGIFVSATRGENLQAILAAISHRLESQSLDESSVLLQVRHAENIERIVRALSVGQKLLTEGASDEFIIAEVQEALMSLFEVLGKRFDDEILDRVFKEFCLGK